jgi:hypothetical protein
VHSDAFNPWTKQKAARLVATVSTSSGGPAAKVNVPNVFASKVRPSGPSGRQGMVLTCLS